MLGDPAEIRRSFFPHHAPSVARINHGSFGSCPTPVLEEQAAFQRAWLAQPDEFCHEFLEDALLKARKEVAFFVGCADVSNLVLLDNATTAAVIVAQQTARAFSQGVFPPGSVVLTASCAYGAVKKVFQHYLVDSGAGARIVEVAVPFPLSSEAEVLAAYEDALRSLSDGAAGSYCAIQPQQWQQQQQEDVKHQHEGQQPLQTSGLCHLCSQQQDQRQRCRQQPVVALAVVDHISSMPSFVFPLTCLLPLLKRHCVQRIFVDGAHAVGNIDVDVDRLHRMGADFYTSNLHKWAFAPTAAAFLFSGKDRRCSTQGDSSTCPPIPTEVASLCRAQVSAMEDEAPTDGGSADSLAPCKCGSAPLPTPSSPTPLHHPIISHNYLTSLPRECAWVGTRDYSPLLAAPHGLRFPANHLGSSLAAVAAHNSGAVLRAAAMLASAWGTALGAPPELCSAMAMVALPAGVGVSDAEGAEGLRRRLRREFGVEVPVLHCWVEGRGGGRRGSEEGLRPGATDQGERRGRGRGTFCGESAGGAGSGGDGAEQVGGGGETEKGHDGGQGEVGHGPTEEPHDLHPLEEQLEAVRVRSKESEALESTPADSAGDLAASGSLSALLDTRAPGQHVAFVRISHQMYNEERDFEKLRDAVSIVCGMGRS